VHSNSPFHIARNLAHGVLFGARYAYPFISRPPRTHGSQQRRSRLCSLTIHLNGSHAHACRPLRSLNSLPADITAGRNSCNAFGQRLSTTTTSHCGKSTKNKHHYAQTRRLQHVQWLAPMHHKQCIHGCLTPANLDLSICFSFNSSCPLASCIMFTNSGKVKHTLHLCFKHGQN
jgi:hypothetical protein